MSEPIDDPEALEFPHLASPLALGAYTVPNFRATSHQRLISNAYMDAVMGTGPRKILISIPQQTGKSEITSFLIPAHYLELFSNFAVPGGYTAIVSNEDSLSLYFSARIRRLIENNPDTFSSKLCADQRAASFWEIERSDGVRGGLFAVGISGSIVGRPISCLVIDDPTKTADQANSEKHREQVWNFYQTVGIGRLQPWTILMVVVVRWGPDDLPGRLLSPDYPGDPSEWRYIRIPAVADEENDPLGREIGQALIRPQLLTYPNPQEMANEWMADIKSSISPYYWSTLWQQDPRDPEGSIFYERCWRFWSYRPTDENGQYPLPEEFDQVVMSWDMTFKDKKDSDFVVGQAWGSLGADRYLIDQVRGRWSFTETKSRVASFARRIRMKYRNALTILVEDKANGPAIIDELRSTVGGLQEFPVNDYGSKQSRAWAVQPLQNGENLYIPSREVFGWVGDFINETASFRDGKSEKNDDVVDAMTQALLHMSKYVAYESIMATADDEILPSHYTRTR